MKRNFTLLTAIVTSWIMSNSFAQTSCVTESNSQLFVPNTYIGEILPNTGDSIAYYVSTYPGIWDTPSNTIGPDAVYSPGNDTLTFVFDESDLVVEIEKYGVIGHFGLLGVSVNYSPMYKMNQTFPITLNGVLVEYIFQETISGWDYYTLRFTGEIGYLRLQENESSLLSICWSANTNSAALSELSNVEFTLSPNPTTDFVNIKADHDFDQIRILDLNGRIVKEEKSDSNATSISVQDLKAGSYFVEVISKGTKSTQQFIKQ